jgi:HD-GYP domain-containing protein (c-di-GMP phosphodiesterase class II)
MLLRPIRLSEGLIGKPLPCDIYLANGSLVASAGTPVADMACFQRLTARPTFCDGAQYRAATEPPSQQISDILDALDRLLFPRVDAIRPTADDFLRLAWKVIAFHNGDPDVAIALARLHRGHSVTARHSLHVAIVALNVAHRMAFSGTEKEALVAAALSMNISTSMLHEELANRATPLRVHHVEHLHRHPLDSARCMCELGVSSELWLKAILHHHELMDGSGYPAGLRSADISLPGRILKIADYYCAKCMPRTHRREKALALPKSLAHAKLSLFGKDLHRLDQQLINVTLSQVGIYPPGTLVRLSNRGIAVVARSPRKEEPPKSVVGIFSPSGLPLREPEVYPIAPLHGEQIRSIVPMEDRWMRYDWQAAWGY